MRLPWQHGVSKKPDSGGSTPGTPVCRRENPFLPPAPWRRIAPASPRDRPDRRGIIDEPSGSFRKTSRHEAFVPAAVIGEFVRAEIEGRQLKNVYRIPRTALRDNTRIWLSNDGNLEIRTVETLWRDAQTVLLTDGLQPGEQLIVSELSKPVDGMPLQVAP